jgi:excisionase family DNA binding protein
MTIKDASADRFAELAGRAARLQAEIGALADELDSIASTHEPEPTRVIAPTLLTVGEAATALSLSRTAVYELMRTGELGSVRIGARRRVPVAAVDAYVARLTGAA